jgi:cytochrome c oxidase subunit 4
MRGIYIFVYIILIIITILEVFLATGIFSYLIMATGILILAGIKATLIALFYQHLKYEPESIKFIPLVALILLSGLLIALITAVPPGAFQSTASSP